jgi:hypothetical protein
MLFLVFCLVVFVVIIVFLKDDNNGDSGKQQTDRQTQIKANVVDQETIDNAIFLESMAIRLTEKAKTNPAIQCPGYMPGAFNRISVGEFSSKGYSYVEFGGYVRCNRDVKFEQIFSAEDVERLFKLAKISSTNGYPYIFWETRIALGTERAVFSLLVSKLKAKYPYYDFEINEDDYCGYLGEIDLNI